MGGMLVFVFAGLCCQAVGNCAADVVQEVRLTLPLPLPYPYPYP